MRTKGLNKSLTSFAHDTGRTLERVVLLVLICLAVFMAWHVVWFLALILNLPSPVGWAWWLGIPAGVRLVLR